MLTAFSAQVGTKPLGRGDDGLAGIQQLAGDATLLFYLSEEGQEGRDAYKEKRAPDFGKFPKRP